MNKIYRKVWNKSLGILVVVSELASSKRSGAAATGTQDSRSHLRAARESLFALAMLAVGTLVSIGTVQAEQFTPYKAGGGTAPASEPGGISIGGNYGTPPIAYAGSVAIGVGADADPSSTTDVTLGAIAIGSNAYSSANLSVSVGAGARAAGTGDAALGANAVASGSNSLAAGSGAKALGRSSIALGGADTRTEGGATQPTVTAAPTAAGNRAIAIGSGAVANGSSSVVIGDTASGGTFVNAIAIGTSATARAVADVAMGLNASAGATGQNVAIGSGATANAGTAAGGAVAIGRGNKANGNGAVAIGDPSVANGQGAIAAGHNSLATSDGTFNGAAANGAVAMGDGVRAGGNGSVSIGSTTTAIGQGSVAMGNRSNAAAAGSMALGDNATALAAGGVALGSGATATNKDDVALGSKSVTSVAKPVSGTVINGNNVIFAGATPTAALSIGGRQIQNVAAGQLSGTSTDAINGSQLFATNSAVDSLSTAVTKGQLHYYSVNDGGTLGGNYGNDGATGKNSVASGAGAKATGINGYAAGTNASATTINSMAIGTNAQVVAPAIITPSSNGGGGIAIGAGALVSAGSTSYPSMAVGYGAQATGIDATALGGFSWATGADATAVGAIARATGNQATALGRGTRAGGSFSLAAGINASAAGASSVALGGYAVARGLGAVATGSLAKATGEHSTALGYGAVSAEKDSIALGSNSLTAAAVATTGTIINGTAYTFAGTSPLSTVSVGGAGTERTISNVAAGSLSATSTDAINGSQLYATNSVLNTMASGGGIKYFHANSTLGDSQANGVDSVAIGPLAVATNANDVALGSNSVTSVTTAVTSAVIGGTMYTFAGNTPTAAMSVGGRQIQDVAAGKLNAASTDAVNGSQLFAANTAIDSLSNTVAASKTHYYSVNDGGVQGKNFADDGAAGVNSVASGVGASAVGEGSVAMGNNAQANNAGDVALGSNSVSSAAVGVSSATINGVTFGGFAGSTPTSTVSVGSVGNERQIQNVAAGQITATSTDAVNGSQLYSVANQITTTNANITNGSTGMLQVSADANTTAPTPVGTNSVAGGNNATASGASSTALGNDAQATAANSVALGAGSIADRANTVSVGSADAPRQMTNVSAGDALTDAVNVSQLRASQSGGVQYDKNADGSSNYQSVTMGNGAGEPTTIHKVGAGTATTDAVNVGQFNTGVQTAKDWSKAYTDSRYQSLSEGMNRIANRANGGIASAMAMASLPQAYAPNQSSAGVAFGSFHGESGIAIGVSTITESGHYIFKANATTNTRGDAGVGLGAAVVW